jgi:hypothetical protein
MITPTLQCMYCLSLLLWCVEDFSVHTGGFIRTLKRIGVMHGEFSGGT